ncbi:MAG: S1C family serine protease [Burkholderiales bacterium]
MRSSLLRSTRAWRACAAVALLASALAAAPAPAQDTREAVPAEREGASVEKLFGALVKVTTHAVPDARSTSSLGADREGTGVVIGDDGLILTIGYLVVEADDVSVIDSGGRTLAARVVAYDHASGFALVRTLAAMAAQPVALGDSAKLAAREPVMIASAGEESVAFAFVASKRPFAGNWEYALDEAIYTTPPIAHWSGAGLFDREGRLLGVGSLIVRNALDDDTALPGNMFVPIDALKPILADLVKSGRRAGPPRPWLGINADELQGRLFVTRVAPDGPADRAGVQAGDIILAVGGDGVRTQAEFYRKVWARGDAGSDIPLRLLQGIEVRELAVRSIDRVDYFRPPTTY